MVSSGRQNSRNETGNDDDLLRVFPVSGELWASYIKDYLPAMIIQSLFIGH